MRPKGITRTAAQQARRATPKGHISEQTLAKESIFSHFKDMCAAVLGPELVVSLLLGVAAVQPVLGYMEPNEKEADVKETLRESKEINNWEEVLKGHRHGKTTGENKNICPGIVFK